MEHSNSSRLNPNLSGEKRNNTSNPFPSYAAAKVQDCAPKTSQLSKVVVVMAS